ncbi:hypothetical protein BS50DRAFT_230816 [Corynespora cassiicola Philippines]|uniref:DUF7702 domain-containing protein n=1 Tax=Corynespora cassiicola Philippines TaxID=1448308 RepID=A0A2T2N204_CORCC|nr:hypothetical protein BS50DRAFT_230816 [Corynespora cassiicola Philippines]
MVRYGAVVNIITLVLYFAYLCTAAFLCYRHGLGHSWPWVCLVILSLCRLAQVSLDLAATVLYEPNTAPDTALESGVAILTEIGLTPLFMATASLLNLTSRPKGRRMQWILLLLHVPLIISLILIIAGGIDPDSREGRTFAATESTKAGISLYLACFVALIWSTTVIASRLYLANSFEVKILTTVVLSLPFFLVDVVYMMCFAFESHFGGGDFNVISGKVTLQLSMQVVMEFLITGLYLALGLGLPDKAARLREQVAELEYDQLRETILWKLYETISAGVVLVVMPALMFAHWMLGKVLRS